MARSSSTAIGWSGGLGDDSAPSPRGLENHSVEVARVAGRTQNQKIELRAIQQVRQNFWSGRGATTSNHNLLLLRSCGGLQSLVRALVDGEQNF